jgi:hypothetical protein
MDTRFFTLNAERSNISGCPLCAIGGHLQLLNYLVGKQQERFRDLKTKALRGL